MGGGELPSAASRQPMNGLPASFPTGPHPPALTRWRKWVDVGGLIAGREGEWMRGRGRERKPKQWSCSWRQPCCGPQLQARTTRNQRALAQAVVPAHSAPAHTSSRAVGGRKHGQTLGSSQQNGCGSGLLFRFLIGPRVAQKRSTTNSAQVDCRDRHQMRGAS